MRYRSLGTSGLMVSVVGLGTNNFGMKMDESDSEQVVLSALDAGITLFDTSNSYGESEARLGKALNLRRGDVVLATKFGGELRPPVRELPDWGARASRRYVRNCVEGSLRRLKTDWIDLYQLHRPDPFTPFEETLSVLTDLVGEGKLRYIGHSNLLGWQVAETEWLSRTNGFARFVSAQCEYSLLNRQVEVDVVPALLHFGLGLIPYFPLASGLLTGKYRRGKPPPGDSRIAAWGQTERLSASVFDRVEPLVDLANRWGVSLLDLAIGGLIAQPAVSSVIAGATTPAQVFAR